MRIPGLFVILSALLAAPVAGVAQPSPCPVFFTGGQPPVLTNARMLQRTTGLCNNAYASLNSGVTHGPLWSAEHLTAASIAAARGITRQGQFHADDRLPLQDRSELDDYRGSGYDRGHLAPSGDMPDEESQQQSFSLANMIPQAPRLNRGVWEGIESAVRDLAVREGEVYVVTGPVFQGQKLKSIGPNAVLAPTSVWKAVHRPRGRGAAAYLCTNTARPSCTTISIAALTRLSGIDPFPALSNAAKQSAVALPRPNPGHYGGGGPARRGNKGIFQ